MNKNNQNKIANLVNKYNDENYKYKGTHQLLNGRFLYANSVYEIVNNLLEETSKVYDNMVDLMTKEMIGKPVIDYDGKTIFLSYEDIRNDIECELDLEGLSLDRKNFIVLEIIKDENGKITYTESL